MDKGKRWMTLLAVALCLVAIGCAYQKSGGRKPVLAETKITEHEAEPAALPEPTDLSEKTEETEVDAKQVEEAVTSDSDEDGVDNDKDACPSVFAESTNGCPWPGCGVDDDCHKGEVCQDSQCVSADAIPAVKKALSAIPAVRYAL